MKISKERQQEIRESLIGSAAELFVAQGFDKTTMKQIAKHAGVGDATIYKYYPNKDALIVGFYNVRGELALAEYLKTESLDEYDFVEKLQLLVDTFFEQLLADREFIELSLALLLKSPIALLKNELSVAKLYQSEIESLLAGLDDDPNYPDIPFPSVMASFLTDCMLGITLYWSKDRSQEFSNTTQLSSLCIEIVDSILKSGLMGKVVEVVAFLVKTHLLRALSNGGGLLSMMQDFKQSMDQYAGNKGADQEKTDRTEGQK